MTEIKLWAFGDLDWVAAKTREEAVHCMRQHCDPIEDDEGDEVPDAKLDQLTFCDDITDPNASEKRTFRQELQRRIDAGESFPQFFATTEF